MFATDEAFGWWWTVLELLLVCGRSGGQARPRDVQG
jgi:hypothetical protein